MVLSHIAKFLRTFQQPALPPGPIVGYCRLIFEPIKGAAGHFSGLIASALMTSFFWFVARHQAQAGEPVVQGLAHCFGPRWLWLRLVSNPPIKRLEDVAVEANAN